MNYFKAAEQVLGSVPTLKRALENLRNREQRLIEQGKPREPGAIDYSKPFTDSHFVSDTLNELLELSECSRNIAETERTLAEVEGIIEQLSDEHKKVVVLWYIEKRSKEAIAEALYVESPTTVYNLRNKAVTKSFITDNCACLRGRGVDYTLNRITAHLRRYYKAHACDGWVLKCDIHHYFPSIRHDIAKAAICKRVKDAQIAAHACDIVDSFGGDVGIGLGSQVSQLVALAVLDDLDHFIKERLRVKHYIRYMDDFILIHEDKEFLQHCRAEIEKQVNAIGLELNGKTTLYPLRQGVKMLQWRFIVTDSGAIIRKMGKKKQGKQRRKLKKLYAKEQSGEYSPGTAHESLVSWLANAARGDTYHERRKMINFYKELEGSYREKQLPQTPRPG